jgi:hypothetical protein
VSKTLARFERRTEREPDSRKWYVDKPFAEWNLLPSARKSPNVRVVTIKHPPPAIEGIPPDKSTGKIYDLPPQLAILMIAAGWVRNDTRSTVRRHTDDIPSFNRRQMVDRRSES